MAAAVRRNGEGHGDRHHHLRVGLGQFAHIIAGSVEALYVVSASHAPVSAYLSRFFIPALAGNIVGGVSLIAALAHAQFVADPH